MAVVESVRANDLSAVQKAITAGKELNVQDRTTGDSLLAIAVAHGSVEMVSALLVAGCDPNFKKSVTPPLSAAAVRGDLQIAQLLLQAGAAVDVKDEDGGTPLMDAASKGNHEMLQLLLRSG